MGIRAPSKTRAAANLAASPGEGEFTVGILGWIVLGLIAGAIAKAIMPGKDPGGLIITIILGIVGALLGGFLASALFDVNPNDGFFDISTWLSAIIGALIVLAIYRAVAGRRTRV